jgi:hypothetical protein
VLINSSGQSHKPGPAGIDREFMFMPSRRYKVCHTALSSSCAIAFVVSLLITSSIMGQTTLPTADVLLQKTRIATTLPTVALTMEMLTANEQTLKPIPTIRKYCRDNDRYDHTVSLAKELGNQWVRDDDEPSERMVVRNGRWISYSFFPGLPPKVLHSGLCDDAWLAGSRVSEDWGSFFDGLISGTNNKSIFDLLAASSNKVTSVIFQGIPCYLIEGRTEFGTIKLWLSPELDFNPKGFAVERLSNDYWDTNRVGNIDPSSALASVTQELGQVQTAHIQGRIVAVAGRFRQRLVYRDGKIIERSWECRRTSIDLSPDFRAMNAFVVSDVPDGTPVRTGESGNSGIIYEWRGGKVVRAIDRSTVNQIDSTTGALGDGTSPLKPKLASPQN